MTLLSAFGLDKEELASDAIKDTMRDIAEELNCGASDFIVVIKPKKDKDNDEKFDFDCFILKATTELVKAVPSAMVRKITMKEIIGDE